MQLDNDGSMLLYVLVIAWVAVKFGIKYHECCIAFLRQLVFIPTFTATHVIPS